MYLPSSVLLLVLVSTAVTSGLPGQSTVREMSSSSTSEEKGMRLRAFSAAKRDANDVTLDNWLNVLLLAEQLRLPELKEQVMDFVAAHSSEVSQQQQWQDLVADHPDLAHELLLWQKPAESIVESYDCLDDIPSDDSITSNFAVDVYPATVKLRYRSSIETRFLYGSVRLEGMDSGKKLDVELLRYDRSLAICKIHKQLLHDHGFLWDETIRAVLQSGYGYTADKGDNVQTFKMVENDLSQQLTAIRNITCDKVQLKCTACIYALGAINQDDPYAELHLKEFNATGQLWRYADLDSPITVANPEACADAKIHPDAAIVTVEVRSGFSTHQDAYPWLKMACVN